MCSFSAETPAKLSRPVAKLWSESACRQESLILLIAGERQLQKRGLFSAVGYFDRLPCRVGMRRASKKSSSWCEHSSSERAVNTHVWGRGFSALMLRETVQDHFTEGDVAVLVTVWRRNEEKVRMYLPADIGEASQRPLHVALRCLESCSAGRISARSRMAR